MEKDIKNFDQFHIAFLEVINKINAAMPGVHYDAPSREEVEASYRSWKDQKDPKVLTALLEKSNINKTDNTLLFTGVAAPPVAMVGKRAAGNIPTLNFVKLVPDVLFVPSVTLLAIVCMKVARKNKKIPEATAKTTKVPAETQPTANTSTDSSNAKTSAPNPADSTAPPRPPVAPPVPAPTPTTLG